MISVLAACTRTQGQAGTGATPGAPSSAASPVAAAPPVPSAAPPLTGEITAPPARPEPRRFAGGASAVSGSHGVVVSVEEQATRAGISVLEAGGNAVDAAVAVAFALSVTHPSAGNLGGGGFMLARPAEGPTVAFDFRESAPRALTRPAFDRMIAKGARGAAAVGVPGTVAGLLQAHERFGKLPRRDVLAPAIALAERGHRLGARQARVLGWSWRWLSRDPLVRRIFAGNGGAPRAAGSRILQPELAQTLARIAEHGASDFYSGRTAALLLQAMGKDGLIAEQDLRGYRAVTREPLSVSYRGFEVQTMPPPSAGGVTLSVELAALERLRAYELPPESADAAHLFLEVSRRAQAVRRFSVVDPDSLSDPDRAARLRRWLNPEALPGWPVERERATPSAAVHPLSAGALRESQHTTHLSVVDQDGFAVSCTVTLSASFGAKLMVPGAGFFLNNAVASFSNAGDNQPAPGRRTTSSMAPTLLLDQGQPVAILGTPGGDTIPGTLVQIVRRMVDAGQPLDEAIRAPRLHHGLVPDQARYESKHPPPRAVLAELEKRGHRLRPYGTQIGDANCIVLGDGVASGYADPREGGVALAAQAPEAQAR